MNIREGQIFKYRLPAIIAVIVIVLIWFAVKGNHRKSDKKVDEQPTISVKTITVGSSLIPNDVSASGTVRPVEESKIAPKIMSNVAAVYVHEGDHVRKGQILIKLESRDLQAQLAEAQAGLGAASAGSNRAYTAIDLQKVQTSTGIASAKAALKAAQEQLSLVKAGPRKQQKAQAHLAVAQAEAQYKNAQIELARMKSLYEEDVVPKQRFDNAQMAYDVSKAQYESAKEQADMSDEGSRVQEIRTAQQQVRQAEEALRMAKASAIQNRMSAKNAQVASSQVNQAQAGVEFAKTQLGYATIISPISGVVTSRMADPGDTVSPGVPVIAIEADSKYRLEVTVPEKSAAEMYIGKTVNVSIGSNNRLATGKVAVISPAGDPASHKFLVKVDLPSSIKPRSGEFGRIGFASSHSSGIIVPESAVHDEGSLPTVFILDNQNQVRMQAVKVGRRINGGLEILSGIQAGDKAVIENSGVLADGAKARIEGH